MKKKKKLMVFFVCLIAIALMIMVGCSGKNVFTSFDDKQEWIHLTSDSDYLRQISSSNGTLRKEEGKYSIDGNRIRFYPIGESQVDYEYDGKYIFKDKFTSRIPDNETVFDKTVNYSETLNVLGSDVTMKQMIEFKKDGTFEYEWGTTLYGNYGITRSNNSASGTYTRKKELVTIKLEKGDRSGTERVFLIKNGYLYQTVYKK